MSVLKATHDKVGVKLKKQKNHWNCLKINELIGLDQCFILKF